MKTQTFGLYTNHGNYGLRDNDVPWWQDQAVQEYRKNRENGNDSDNPNGEFPKDGIFTWIKGTVKDDGYVYGIKESDGYYHYEIKYDEGINDKKWMQEKDIRYLARLEKEGNLEKQEPEEFKRLVAIGANNRRGGWNRKKLESIASLWIKRTRKKLGFADEKSEWWLFIPFYEERIDGWIDAFKAGLYKFSPIREYRFPNGMGWAWQYPDRLAINWILMIIRPTFKRIISPLCSHITGPSAIKGVTTQITAALNTGQFNYCLRIDIKSYYASINHKILINQLTDNFDDQIILKYLKDIITIGVDRGGQVFLPTQGIPRQSALSPFFGALYLSLLDKAFTNRNGCFYLRYMDDVIVLIKTKKQYTNARKRMFAILKELRLQLSPRKTRMGLIHKGFHFLGMEYELPQSALLKNQAVVVKVHPRTPRRAHENVKSLFASAVNPDRIQRYLFRWATWWCRTVGLSKQDLIFDWMCIAAVGFPESIWIGRKFIAQQSFWFLAASLLLKYNPEQIDCIQSRPEFAFLYNKNN